MKRKSFDDVSDATNSSEEDDFAIGIKVRRLKKTKEIVLQGDYACVQKNDILSKDKKKNDAKKGKGKRVAGDIDYPQLRTRTNPFTLVDACCKMNEAQRNAVKDLGFEHILALGITEVPSRMAYWVVNCFEPRSCELVLESGRRIHIEPQDVHRVFGFPMGKIKIDRVKRDAKCKLLVEWMDIFGLRKSTIGQRDVVDKMLEEEDGGVWFKRHFMVLLVSSLMEHTSHGYVLPNIMPYLQDVEKIRDMDWCKYALKCLVENKRTWEKEKHKAFLGSALFLTVRYFKYLGNVY